MKKYLSLFLAGLLLLFSTGAFATDGDPLLAPGSSEITTVGTISSGAWHGTAVDDAYIASAAAWNAKQSALTNPLIAGTLTTGYFCTKNADTNKIDCNTQYPTAAALSAAYIDWNGTGGASIQNKPTIPAAQIQSDWSQSNNGLLDYIKNKPTIPSTLADLSDDSTHRLSTDTEKTILAEITNKTIPRLMTTNKIWGGEVTIDEGNLTFSVAAGGGEIIINSVDPANPVRTQVTWDAMPNITPISAPNYQVYITIQSDGSLRQANTFSGSDFENYIVLGGVAPVGGYIAYKIDFTVRTYNFYSQFLDSWSAFGTFNISGNIFSASGANLKVSKNEGETFYLGSGEDDNPNRFINVASPDFYFPYLYRDSGGNWIQSTISQYTNPDLLDTVTGPVAVNTNKWTIQYIFFAAVVGSGNLGLPMFQYGQTEYDSLEEAQLHLQDEFVQCPLFQLKTVTFRGWLIVKQGATSLRFEDGKAVFKSAGMFGLSSAISAGSGEINTASNIGTEGIGLYHGKVGTDLQFKDIRAGSNKITVADNPTYDTVDIDVVPASISHTAIGDIGTNSHSAIDTALSRLADTSGTNTGDTAGAGTAQWNANKIQGKDFPVLGVGDDEKYPKYDHDTGAFVMTTIAGGGDVTGPASAVGDNFASFNSTTGRLIKDSGSKAADFAVAAKGVTNGDSHDHNGGDGGQIAYGSLSGQPTIPTDISGAGYWTKTTETNLSNEVVMGALGNGLILNTTTTGIPTIYGGASCTNQFPRSLNASGAATCVSVGDADFSGTLTQGKGGTGAGALTCTNQFLTSNGTAQSCITDTLASAQHANQGTTTTVLHGNASGNPNFGAVVNADITSVSGSKITTEDATTTAIGKSTPSTVVANICNAGSTDTCNTFRIGAHTHQNATGSGGTLAEAALNITDLTTGNVTTSAHGFAPKGTAGTTQFWRQDWTLATPGGGSAVGLFDDMQFSILQSDGTLNAASGVQTWAGTNKTAQDVFAVDANSTYLFRGQYIINTGATTHTTAMAFALTTATVASFEYTATLWAAAANTISTTANFTHVSGVASKVLNATGINVYTIITFQGEFVTGTGGTITPQINFSANPTGTNLMKRGSYIVMTKLGADTVVDAGGWQ